MTSRDQNQKSAAMLIFALIAIENTNVIIIITKQDLVCFLSGK
jgi:hypothetical protein